MTVPPVDGARARPEGGDAAIGSVPWIDAELRARLGEGASVGALVFEGRMLRVEGARLPLGRGSLAIESASIELGAGLPLGPLPLSARLVAMRGVITADDVRIPVELTAGPRREPAFFDGALSVRGASVSGLGVELDAAVTLTAAALHAREARLRIAVAGHRWGGSGWAPRSAPLGSAAQPPAPPNPPDLEVVADLALELAASAPLPSAFPLRGALRAASIEVRRGEAALRVEDLSTSLDLDLRRLRYADLAAHAHGARITGWGRVPIAAPTGAEGVPLAALAVADAGAAVIEAALALSAGEVSVRIPADLAAGGEAMIRLDRTVASAFHVTTPRSNLRLRVAIGANGSLLGSTVRGALAIADAAAFGVFPGPVRPRPEGRLDLDAHLTGTVTAPGFAGRVSSPGLTLDVSADPEHPSFRLEDASVLLDVDRDRVIWHRLAGRFYGGTFVSSGRFGLDAGALDATLGFSGVRVEEVPTQARGPSALAKWIQGAAAGEIRFEMHPHGGPLPTARGSISISEPRYLAVAELAPLLARYGLPRVRSHGRGPASAHLRFEQELLRVEGLSAAVDGIEVGGDLRAGLDGRIAGQVLLQIHAEYLAQSPLLVLPAAFAGRVAVPVELGGTVRAPEIRTDARGVLESLLAENRVGEAVKSVLDGFRVAAEERRRERRRRRHRKR